MADNDSVLCVDFENDNLCYRAGATSSEFEEGERCITIVNIICAMEQCVINR